MTKVPRSAGQERSAASGPGPSEYWLGNGTAIFLPYDHGLEHGPRDFVADPASADPKYIIKLALEGGFNGIAIQIGLASKFYWEYAGEVPLVLKLKERPTSRLRPTRFRR
jgi:DhnA family fructose-bisphosphate aldolase class Ia